MAEIVNLRMARKRAKRTEAERQAAENRTIHGRTRAERLTVDAERARMAQVLDGHRLAPARKDDSD